MQFQPYSSSEVRRRKLRDDSGKKNYSILNRAHLCILCIMTQPHHTLISYQITFWTPLLIGFTIDTYQNNYYLRWELRLVSLIEGIKADGKD